MKILACEMFRDESTILYNVAEWKSWDIICSMDESNMMWTVMAIKIPAILKCPWGKMPYGVENTGDEKLFQIKHFPTSSLLSMLLTLAAQ